MVHFLHSFCRRTPRRWRRGVLSDFCDVTSPPQAIPPVKAPQGNPAPTGPAAGSFQPRLNGNHHRNFVSMWLTVPIHKRNLPLTSVCHKAGTTVQAVLEAANLPPTECANYFIKGQCRYAGCRNTHTDRALPQENADRALALIRPAMPLF